VAATAPTAAYEKIVQVLNACLHHDDAIIFAYLSDISFCPCYGFEVKFADADINGKAVAVLIHSKNKLQLQTVGTGRKVCTRGIANLEGTRDYAVACYCNLDCIMDFKLDPPRGQRGRYAAVLSTHVEKFRNVRARESGVHRTKRWRKRNPDLPHAATRGREAAAEPPTENDAIDAEFLASYS
jgi:hypothetical protein